MKILLIDDDPSDAFLARNYLYNLNLPISIDYFKDVDSALSAFQERHYDLVVIDLNLGRVSGYEVIRLLKSIDPNIDVVVHTGSREMLDVKLAYDIGAIEVLTKDIDFDQLLNYVSKFYRCVNCVDGSDCWNVGRAKDKDDKAWRIPAHCPLKSKFEGQQAEKG